MELMKWNVCIEENAEGNKKGKKRRKVVFVGVCDLSAKPQALLLSASLHSPPKLYKLDSDSFELSEMRAC